MNYNSLQNIMLGSPKVPLPGVFNAADSTTVKEITIWLNILNVWKLITSLNMSSLAF